MYKGKKIALLIPAFNEERSIGNVLKNIPEYIDLILVVDDGSIDKTVDIAKELNAKVISHSQNLGVGAAFKTGINKIINEDIDILVNIDADGQFNPSDIVKLILPIINGEAEFVTASRFMCKEFYPEMSEVKFWGNKFMAWFISKLTNKRFYDVSCGFRAYHIRTLYKLNLFGQFTYTQETFIDLAFKDINIKEVPLKIRGRREHGKSRIASNLFKYAFKTLKIIVRTYRDYKPFRLFGYMSLASFLTGSFFFLFLMFHYLQTNEFTPHKWAGFLAGFLGILAFIFLLTGFILDMFSRMRNNQEEILYQLKSNKNKK